MTLNPPSLTQEQELLVTSTDSFTEVTLVPLYPSLRLCCQGSRKTSSYAFVIIRRFCCWAEQEGGGGGSAQAWQVALWLTAKISRKLQRISYMNGPKFPVLDLQVHFSPSQLLWASEVALFALRNARIIQAFSSAECAWLLFYAPGRKQNISEVTLPSKSLCRQEVRLLTLSKMQFSFSPGNLSPGPAATRCQRYRAGGSRRRPGPALPTQLPPRRGGGALPRSKANAVSLLLPLPARPSFSKGAKEPVINQG